MEHMPKMVEMPIELVAYLSEREILNIFLENCKKKKTDSLFDAFDWRSTPQSGSFWAGVSMDMDEEGLRHIS